MEKDDEHTVSEGQISHGHASSRSLTCAVEQTAEEENTGYKTDMDWNVIDSDVIVAAAVAGSTALDADATTVDDDEQTVVDDHTTAVDHDPTAVDDDLRAVDSEVTAPDDDRATPAPAPVDSSSEPSTSVPQQQMISSPPDGWMLNSDEYFTRVAQLIKWSFYKTCQRLSCTAFENVYEELNYGEHIRRRTSGWSPIPLDASLLMFGKKRDVFDMIAFVRKYPQSSGDLENLRKSTNVRVMPDRCLFFTCNGTIAMKKKFS